MKTTKLLIVLPVFLTAALTAALVPAEAADAVTDWGNHCSSCHGADGKGATKMGKKLRIKDFTDAAYQATFTDEASFKAVREGIKSDDGRTRMKPIEGLNDEEINALVAYVRSLKK